ncbi:protein FAM227B-like [Acipenser ruthenus]|uniref:protein FAM227B-like n=1 Tax=Acipenser ruthenus TaxID=7906 RepID=UPI00145A7C09|nr:protein FAM227B-like [Acipenser ruthenus]XP_058851099.1 protein FAM227B-like [Acipenser ruthenus]
MQEAPTTFEEFLQFQKLTAWPITLEEDIQITGELAVYRSPNAIADYLCKNAPFPMEVIDSRKAAFLKIWKTFFLSEASVAVFKDGFWWYFLHKFKVYADCLAQAIFSAFYEAFSMSHNHFGDDFKTELTDLICLWVSGIKPLPFIWK